MSNSSYSTSGDRRRATVGDELCGERCAALRTARRRFGAPRNSETRSDSGAILKDGPGQVSSVAIDSVDSSERRRANVNERHRATSTRRWPRQKGKTKGNGAFGNRSGRLPMKNSATVLCLSTGKLAGENVHEFDRASKKRTRQR